MSHSTPHARDVAGHSWDPGQYLKFADHRLRPAMDLIGRIPAGRSSPHLRPGLRYRQRHPHARRSLAGRRRHGDGPLAADARSGAPRPHRGCAGSTGDLADWQPEQTPSLLFSNAVIHWLPDHRSLITRLWSLLPPGGCLAVQAPMSCGPAIAPPHARDPCRGGADGTPLGDAELRRATASRGLHDPGFYYDLLAADAAHLDVWNTEYQHAPHRHGRRAGVGGPPPACARSWPALGDADRATFLDANRDRLRHAYPPRPDGITLYPFLRLLFVAVRG